MKHRPKILICDDEYLIRLWLAEHLEEAGYPARAVGDGASLLEAVAEESPDLVLLDLRLPDGSGLDFLRRLKEEDPALPIIMMTAYGEVETAVAAVRAGAFHFLEKPIELSELLLLAEQALKARRLVEGLERYREGHRWQFSDITLVGRSPAIRRTAEIITRLGVKGTPANVLIRGESGTGKDVVARAIHARGPRQGRPFISVNCTALPESLVESELFGHEKGAFTDAREKKRGLLELADGGTVFLDEIGDMPPPTQGKLLHFLETQVLRPVGGVKDLPVNVHVVTATNRNLEDAVEAGTFREDLFYRLNVVPIYMPPLRERPEDIGPLALHFVELLAREMKIEPRPFEPDALEALEEYAWPGNARQLRNVLERILLLEDEASVRREHLPPEIRGLSASEGPVRLPPSGVDMEDLERDLILQALRRTGGNKSQAARLLGLSRDTLRYRIDKYRLDEAAV